VPTTVNAHGVLKLRISQPAANKVHNGESGSATFFAGIGSVVPTN